jgi:hypothetical protein
MVGMTIALTCMVLAGHAQIALYLFVSAFLYVMYMLYSTRRVERSIWLLMVAALTVCLTSIQWIPLWEGLKLSSRLADTSVWLKDGWFVPWQHLVQFVAPDFFGNPATLNYWGVWNYGEFVGYIGILPLILAIYALIGRLDKITAFFMLLLGGAFVFMMPTAWAKLPFEYNIPLLSTLQPTRLMVVVDISLIILAALGLDAYIKKPTKRIYIAIGAIGVVLAGLWIYINNHIGATDLKIVENLTVAKRNLILPTVLFGASGFVLIVFSFVKRWRNVFLVCMLAIVSFDLFRFGWKFTPFVTSEYFFPTTAAVSFLQSQPKPFRVMSMDNRIMPPNVNAYYGIESIEGYDPVYEGRYEEFMASLNRREANIRPPFGFNRIITGSTFLSPLFPLLNVKYVLSLEDIKNESLELMYKEGNTRVYWYKKALPRVYTARQVHRISSKQEFFDIAHEASFDPTLTAIVEEPVDFIGSPSQEDQAPEILAYETTDIRIRTAFENDQFVVISNMYAPGWKATIDGKEVRLLRTNYVFQGVLVSKGEHEVRVYIP